MELSNYISPLKFQDLCNGKSKVILKRVYKKMFVNSAICMTLNRTTCRLFTFEVTIMDDDDADVAVFLNKEKNKNDKDTMIVHVLRILSFKKISDFYGMWWMNGLNKHKHWMWYWMLLGMRMKKNKDCIHLKL